MRSYFIVAIMIAVAMLALSTIPTRASYSYPHERPDLEPVAADLLRGLLGQDYEVLGTSSEIVDTVTDRNYTFVSVTLKGPSEKVAYDVLFWNDQPTMIFLIRRSGIGAQRATSIDDLAEKYLVLLGRTDNLEKYHAVKRYYVSGDSQTLVFKTYVRIPAKMLEFTLFQITMRGGVVEEINDLTFVKLPMDPAILPENILLDKARTTLPKAMSEYNIKAKVSHTGVDYFIGLEDPSTFKYGVFAQIDFYFERVLPDGTYGMRITMNAETGEVAGWSPLGAFGITPLTKPRPQTSQYIDGRIDSADNNIVVSFSEPRKTSTIVVNYHSDESGNVETHSSREITPADPVFYAPIVLLATIILYIRATGRRNPIYFLATAIMLITLLLSLTNQALASVSSVLGSRYLVPDYEQQYDSQATSKIAQYSSSAVVCWEHFGTTFCAPRFSSVKNLYGSQTTVGNIYDAAEGFGEDSSVAFYIGHGDIAVLDDPQGTLYFWFITSDSGDEVLDYGIHSHTSAQPNLLVFLWSCEQGDVIGGYYNGQIPYGMPHAWLHTTQLSEDGYNNPDDSGLVFLGFKGPAPFLSSEIGGVDEAGYKFLVNFYYALMMRGMSVKASLDYAASTTWGVSSWNNIPLTSMVVYGDSTIRISDPPPPGWE